jgi:signal transduction histidine kinase
VPDPIATAVFGLLFERSGDAAFIVSRETGRVLSANLGAADLLLRDVDSIVGMAMEDLAYEPDRDLLAAGHYEDVGLRRGDEYPVYVELQVAHVDSPEHGALAAYMARDTGERRVLERELLAKHTALYNAYAELERTHGQLADAQRELEGRNREVALLAWRAAMGELVAGIAHHLNNPVGALSSTVRRMTQLASVEPVDRAILERLLVRCSQLVQRIETNVSAIIEATKANEPGPNRPILPPELANVQSTFVERLEHAPRKELP